MLSLLLFMDVTFGVYQVRNSGFVQRNYSKPHDISLTLLAFYTGGNGLIKLLPTKGVVNVGVVPPTQSEQDCQNLIIG